MARHDPAGDRDFFFGWVMGAFSGFVIGCATCVLLAWADPAQGAEARADTALVFAVDCSGSMTTDEVGLERDAYEQALQSPDVLEAIAEGNYGRVEMAYIEFHEDGAQAIVPWTVVANMADARTFIAGISANGGCNQQGAHVGVGNTPIGAAIKAGLQLLVAPPLPADRLVLDVNGDGSESGTNATALTGDPHFCDSFLAEPATGGDQESFPPKWLADCTVAALAVVRQAAVDAGITINGLPMVATTNEGDLLEWYCGDPITHAGAHVVAGAGGFCAPLNDIADFTVTLRNKIVQELY